MKKTLKYIGGFLSFVLPVTSILFFIGIDFVISNISNVFWCALYGCIAICIFYESKLFKAVMIMLNLAIISLFAFVSLMGGICGVLLVLLHMIIPFYGVFYRLWL